MPELRIRRLLHASGLRFRVDYAPVLGVRSRPDIVFTRAKVIIFVDGCFWHGCPEHYRPPTVNSGYWQSKLETNLTRDHRSSAAFEAAGWTVLRYWEHEDANEVANDIRTRYAAIMTDQSHA